MNDYDIQVADFQASEAERDFDIMEDYAS